MIAADRPRLARALMVLGETFNEPVSELRAEGYFEALRDLTIEAVEQAIHHALRSCRFFPKPAELREFMEGATEATAAAAWLALVREIRRTGYTGRPELEGTTRAVMEQIWGSWVTLCETLPAEGPGYTVWEKRFRETYRIVEMRERIALMDGRPVRAVGSRTSSGSGEPMPALVGVEARRSDG